MSPVDIARARRVSVSRSEAWSEMSCVAFVVEEGRTVKVEIILCYGSTFPRITYDKGSQVQVRALGTDLQAGTLYEGDITRLVYGDRGLQRKSLITEGQYIGIINHSSSSYLVSEMVAKCLVLKHFRIRYADAALRDRVRSDQSNPNIVFRTIPEDGDDMCIILSTFANNKGELVLWTGENMDLGYGMRRTEPQPAPTAHEIYTRERGHSLLHPTASVKESGSMQTHRETAAQLLDKLEVCQKEMLSLQRKMKNVLYLLI